MIEIVWEYVVRPEAVQRFRRAYGPRGEWAGLFGRHQGYRGTTLLVDTSSAQRFLTIDSWETEEHFEAMRRTDQAEYSRLDELFDGMTISERKVGVFEPRGGR